MKIKDWLEEHRVDVVLAAATIGIMAGVAMVCAGSYKLGCAMTIAEFYETLYKTQCED